MSMNIGAIILAAGKGTRMKSTDTNKVALSLGGKPMIEQLIEFLEGLSIDSIVVVVGFAKESVMNALRNKQVVYAEQKEQLGTANAVATGLKQLPAGIKTVLVAQGDDSVFYNQKNLSVFNQLLTTHTDEHAALTFLTVEPSSPTGLGRIVRDTKGKLVGIVEEKDATEEQRKISEINAACYVFSIEFLNKYLPKVEKSQVTGEYYLTHLIDMAIANNEVIKDVRAGKVPWRGVNTPEELSEAEKLYLQNTNHE